MAELDGKVAVITGAGSGMGRASARLFVRGGHECSLPTSADARNRQPRASRSSFPCSVIRVSTRGAG